MNPVFFILFSVGVIYVIAGYIQKKYPPKKINHFYGYRTSRSQKNQEIWDFAQQYSAHKMIKMGIITLVISALAYVFDYRSEWEVWIAIFISILFPIAMIIEIEKKLKKQFPES